MANLKAISRRSLKQILARCFILLDRCKERLTVQTSPLNIKDIKKIVLVEMQGFGDALAVLPTAKALKEKFPEAKLTLITQKVAKDLFKNSPIFDEIIPLGISKTKLGVADFIRSISKLRRVEYDLLIIPSWSLRHTAVSLIIRSKAKLGYLHDYSLRLTYHNDFPVEARNIVTRKEAKYLKEEHIIIRALKTLEPLGIQNSEARYQIEVSPKERMYVSELLRQRFGLNEDQHLAIISPGAVWKERAWSLENWKRLIEMLSASNNLKFIIIGSAEEQETCSFLCDSLRTFNLCGYLNLSQLAALIERCSIFIGVDSGPMHLAAALNKPVVALFGPNIPEVSGPKGDLNFVVQKEMQCRPCNQDYCPVPKGKRCMDLISPEDVLRAYNHLMTKLRHKQEPKDISKIESSK